MALPSEFTPPTPVIEMAFGADLDDPTTWEWADVSGAPEGSTVPRLHDRAISITRGSADESSQAQPMSTSFVLDNPDGALTPDDPRSIYYPHVKRDTPVRITLPGYTPASGESFLWVPSADGAGVVTPDDASLHITGDLDIRFEAQIGTTSLWARRIVPGALSWFAGATAEVAYIIWSPDGTQGSLLFTSGQRLGYATRITIDVDDGLGNNVTSFYRADSLDGPWELVDTVTQAGTTSIHAGTAPLVLGLGDFDDFTGVLTAPQDGGRFFRVEIRDGIDGTIVANPDFRSLAPGTTSFTDSAGRTWTMEGGALVVGPGPERFLGQVAKIAPTWPYGDTGEARVSIAAAGFLRRLSQGQKPLRSALYRVILGHAEKLLAYWPGEDGRDAAQLTSPIAGVSPFGFGGNFEPGTDDTLASSESLPSVSGGQPAGWSAPVPPRPGINDWRYDMFVRIPTLAPSAPGTPLAVIHSTGLVRRWEIAVWDGVARVRGWFAGNETSTPDFEHSGSPTSDFFADWARIGIRPFQAGANVSYDFLRAAVGGNVFGFTETVGAGQVGYPTSVANLFSSAPTDGVSFGHWVFSTDTELTWLGGIAAAAGGHADTAYDGETAADRFSRLCAEESVPGVVFGDPYDSARMGPQGTKTFLELLQECADTDMGILSELTSTLGLAYRPRSSLTNQEPRLSLDAGRGAQPWKPGDISNSFAPMLDDKDIRNDVTVTRDGGSSARVTTDPPPSPGDLYDEDVTLSLHSDGQALNQASWRLHLGTWPGMRYRSLSVPLDVAPHQIPDWLLTQLGDRVHVDNLPPQHPTDTVDLLVRGVAENFSITRWTLKANLSPAGPWTVAERDDDELAKRDTAGSATTHDFESGTDTELDVYTTLGPLWTTDPAEFPFDINAGGVRLTATAIGAAPTSSPADGDGAQSLATSTSHVAPSVTAQGGTDLLVCAWCSWEQSVSAYSAPGSMDNEVATGGGVWSDMLSATEQLAAAGATGTRTATYGAADRWSALSVVVRGNPSVTIEEALSGYGSGEDVTLETGPDTEAGWWLLAIQGWDWDPTRIQGQPRGPIPPPGTELPPDTDRFAHITASGAGGDSVSRIQAWTRIITTSGRQRVTFAHNAVTTSPPGDNHCRLFVLSGVLAGQPFTITQTPVNGIEKTILAGSDVRLWTPATRAL